MMGIVDILVLILPVLAAVYVLAVWLPGKAYSRRTKVLLVALFSLAALALWE